MKEPRKDWARGNPIFDEAAEICTQLVVEEIGVGKGVGKIRNLLSTTRKEAYEKGAKEARSHYYDRVRQEAIEECVGVLEERIRECKEELRIVLQTPDDEYHLVKKRQMEGAIYNLKEAIEKLNKVKARE